MDHLRFARRASRAALLAILFGPGAALAQKSLHWRALDVKARLDADGKLHVVERHAMVFTGDWNGGERSFRLFPGQRLSVEGIRRLDPKTGAATDLKSGSLDDVDRYAFTGPRHFAGAAAFPRIRPLRTPRSATRSPTRSRACS